MARNLIVANNAVGSIDGSLSSSATTLILNDISNFPILTDVDDYCILTLIRESDGAIEYVECTSQNIANRSYEVLRGVEDTTPLVFTEGDEVRNLLTAAQIDSFLSSTGGTSTGSYTFGDLSIGTGGPLALTLNDGYGNTNVCFNHKAGIADQNGNAGRIIVNTDAVTFPTMDFQIGANLTAGTPTTLTDGMILTLTELKPRIDNAVSLGTSDKAWDDLWLKGTIDIGDTTLSSSQLKVGPVTLNPNNMELGDNADSLTYIDLHATSDASQSDYSTRINRNAGVNGHLELQNKGTGHIRLISGGEVQLDPVAKTIYCNNSRVSGVLSPTYGLDAVNKNYVDALVGPGALLGSISLAGLAEGGNEKIVAGSASWDNYGYIKVIVEDLTTTDNLAVAFGLGVKDSDGSWCGLPPGWSVTLNDDRYLSPVNTSVVRPDDPSFGSSYEFDLYSSGNSIAPYLRAVNNINGMYTDLFQPQGYGVDATSWATGAPTGMKYWGSSFSSWSNRSIGLKTANIGSETIATGTLKILGFTYPS